MNKYKIKDIGKVVTGKTPSTKNKLFYSPGEHLFVCPPDIKNTRFVENSSKFVSSLAINKFDSIVLNQNSILIDCIGADMGNVAITSRKCITNQQINSITNIDTSKVIPMYLYYYFSTKKSFFQLIGQNGSTMPIINKTLFECIELSIHSISEQQHIVNTIGSVDDLLENYNRQIHCLEKMGLLYIENLFEIGKTEKITNIARFVKGREVGSKNYCPYGNNKINYIRVGDLMELQDIYIDKNQPHIEASYDDILIAFDGAPGRNSIGLTGAISSGIQKVDCESKNKGLIYFALNSSLNQQIIKDNSQGTTILHGSRAIQFLVIPKTNESNINYLNTIFCRIVNLKNIKRNLMAIKKILLNKYFG